MRLILWNERKNEKPVMLIVTGYPADGASVPLHALDKKPLDQICAFVG
jgi:hypothetical protein